FAYLGIGAGGAAAPLIANWLTSRVGWPAALRLLGLLMIAIASSPSRDRKSTRLNSSHRTISYAVFCLKKKKKQYKNMTLRITALTVTYRTMRSLLSMR